MAKEETKSLTSKELWKHIRRFKTATLNQKFQRNRNRLWKIEVSCWNKLVEEAMEVENLLKSSTVCIRMHWEETKDKPIFTVHVLMQSVRSSQMLKSQNSVRGDSVVAVLKESLNGIKRTYSKGWVKAFILVVNAHKCALWIRRHWQMTFTIQTPDKSYLNHKLVEGHEVISVQELVIFTKISTKQVMIFLHESDLPKRRLKPGSRPRRTRNLQPILRRRLWKRRKLKVFIKSLCG